MAAAISQQTGLTYNRIMPDTRLQKIISLIVAFAQGNLNERIETQGEGDELEAIAIGLNMLGEELSFSKKELADYTLNQQRLITEVTIRAQEQERHYIGLELHDNINQVLATIKMQLGMAVTRPGKGSEALISKSLEYVDYTIEEIRKLSKELVAPSLVNYGLTAAIEHLVIELNSSGTVKVVFTHQSENENLIPNDLLLMLYRVTQQQLNNIYKHSKADTVTIDFIVDPKNVSLTVSDNGIGFDTSKRSPGIGLQNIVSRIEYYSGTVSIKSSHGKGCTINLSIPINS